MNFQIKTQYNGLFNLLVDNNLDHQCQCRDVRKSGGRLVEESMCSDSATLRGSGQKVISFSVFGRLEPYYDNVWKNLELMRK